MKLFGLCFIAKHTVITIQDLTSFPSLQPFDMQKLDMSGLIQVFNYGFFSKTRYCLKERGVKLTHLSFLYLYWPWNWNWDSNVTRERIRALPCAIKDRVFIHFMPVLQPSNPSVFQLRFWRNIGLGYDIVIDWDCLSKQTQQPLSSTETVCFSKPDKQALILGSWSLEAGYDDRASKKLQEVKKEDGWEYAIRLASV